MKKENTPHTSYHYNMTRICKDEFHTILADELYKLYRSQEKQFITMQTFDTQSTTQEVLLLTCRE